MIDNAARPQRWILVDVTIVHGAKTVNDLVYKGWVGREWDERPDVNLFATVDPGGETPDWKGKVGFTPNVLGESTKGEIAVAIKSGPPHHDQVYFPSTEKLGFKDEEIYTTLENRMKCAGIGKCGRCNVGPMFVCKDGPVFSKVQLNALPPEF